MVEPRVSVADTVREAIDHALLSRRMSGKMLARQAGLTDRTWARRRALGDWTIRELEAVAAALGLGIGDLLQGSAHVVRVLEGGELLPHLDSNQEPSGLQSDALVAA